MVAGVADPTHVVLQWLRSITGRGQTPRWRGAPPRARRRARQSVYRILVSRPESDDWRLVLGSDAVDREGPTRANRQLLDVFREKEIALSPLEVDLVGRRDPLVEMLRALPSQPMPLRAPMHIYRTLVGEHYVDNAYVYRLGFRSDAAAAVGGHAMSTPPSVDTERSES